MPNFSATLLLTRPQDASERFASALAPDLPQGVRIVISPLLDIVPTGATVSLSGYAGVIFTSGNAIRFAGPPAPVPAYCVGAQTRQRAEAAGWSAALDEETAEELYAALTKVKPNGPLLHLAGQHRRGALAERLTKAGLPTDECVLYDQRTVPFTPDARAVLAGPAPVIAPLFSPRTAQAFAEQYAGSAPLYLVAISDAALKPTQDLQVAEACAVAQPTALAVKRHILEVLRRVEAGGTPL
jgi:uroporphyrinogen-III synthase